MFLRFKMNVRSEIEIVTFTTLYPNSIQPNHGVFVETRLRQLLATGYVASRVVAPVPWFPFSSPAAGSYARYAKVPREERRADIRIAHPRYVVLPKIGMSLTPHSLYRAALPALRRLQAERDFDLIDAHYFYPDGVAAVRLGQALNKPVVITARGSDVNLIPNFTRQRRMILNAAEKAAGVIAVSQALKEAMVALGMAPEKIAVLRNGVDTGLFRQLDAGKWRSVARGANTIVLSVGNLLYSKGHDLVIRALKDLPGDTHLLIAGEGPERRAFEELTGTLGLKDRVHFLGSVRHAEMPALYSAADVLVLATEREGWPNVLLEAMACGTPVVASKVGGIPEIVTSPEAGIMLDSRSAESIATAIKALLAARKSREAVRAHALNYGWSDIVEGQIEFYRKAAGAVAV